MMKEKKSDHGDAIRNEFESIRNATRNVVTTSPTMKHKPKMTGGRLDNNPDETIRRNDYTLLSSPKRSPSESRSPIKKVNLKASTHGPDIPPPINITSHHSVNIRLLLMKGREGFLIVSFSVLLLLFLISSLHFNTRRNENYNTNDNGMSSIYEEPRNIVRRNARVLMGIFSADLGDDTRYRNAFRDLLVTHPNVCKLSDYMSNMTLYPNCELVYTFVLGITFDDNVTTQIVSNHNVSQPIVSPTIPKEVFSNDLNEPDITFLNIKYVHFGCATVFTERRIRVHCGFFFFS